MALIKCSECGTEVSDKASSCPKCGAPIAKSAQTESSTPILGIVSVGLGIGAVLMPYFAAVFLVPAAIICGVIAIRKSQKALGVVGTVLGLIGVAGIIYTSNQITQITGGGLEKQAAEGMQGIYNQVSSDAEKQYDIAKRSGSAIDACVHAGMVAAAYLQAKDESNYQRWKSTESNDCTKAGLPR